MMKKYFLIILLTVYVVLTTGFYMLSISKPAFNFITLAAGNTMMALLTLFAYLMVRSNLEKRPQAFVRGVMGSSFLKLMVCMVGVLAYVLLNKDHIHKPTVFVLFGIYALYTIIETSLLSKLVRVQK
jgi:hypothetical protein